MKMGEREERKNEKKEKKMMMVGKKGDVGEESMDKIELEVVKEVEGR